MNAESQCSSSFGDPVTAIAAEKLTGKHQQPANGNTALGGLWSLIDTLGKAASGVRISERQYDIFFHSTESPYHPRIIEDLLRYQAGYPEMDNMLQL